jgi:hypothetical protein
VFNFLSHKGNTNQSYTRISSHPSQIDHHPKKPKNNKCWSGCREKETFIHCRWECELVYPLWKSVCRFLKKLKIDLSYNPTIAVLAYIQGSVNQYTREILAYPCLSQLS